MKMNLLGEVAKTLVLNLRTHHDRHVTQAEYQARFPCNQALPPMVIAVFSHGANWGCPQLLDMGLHIISSVSGIHWKVEARVGR